MFNITKNLLDKYDYSLLHDKVPHCLNFSKRFFPSNVFCSIKCHCNLGLVEIALDDKEHNTYTTSMEFDTKDNDNDLINLFIYVKDYLIPYYTDRSEDNRLKLLSCKNSLLKNVQFPKATNEWASSEDTGISISYKKEYDNFVATISFSNIRNDATITLFDKRNFANLNTNLKMRRSIDNDAIDAFEKFVDKVMIPYYNNNEHDPDYTMLKILVANAVS